MKKTQNTSDDLSVIHFISVFIAVILSFVGAMIIYEPLTTLEFDFIFFDDISISKVTGSWSNVVKYVSSMVFVILTGISCFICVRNWKLPYVACIPLALLFGALGLGAMVIALGFILAILATIVAIYALFFGPGDR